MCPSTWPLFRYQEPATIEAAERRSYQKSGFFVQLAGVTGLATMHKSARTDFVAILADRLWRQPFFKGFPTSGFMDILVISFFGTDAAAHTNHSALVGSMLTRPRRFC